MNFDFFETEKKKKKTYFWLPPGFAQRHRKVFLSCNIRVLIRHFGGGIFGHLQSVGGNIRTLTVSGSKYWGYNCATLPAFWARTQQDGAHSKGPGNFSEFKGGGRFEAAKSGSSLKKVSFFFGHFDQCDFIVISRPTKMPRRQK